MKYIKLFENHITEEEVAKICQQYHIKNWSLNSDGTVDVRGGVLLSRKGLNFLPFKFGKVEGSRYFNGNFDCSGNNIKSLEGCPSYVDGHLWCDINNLTSLEGSPKYVGGDFSCYDNNIKSFEGIVYIGGFFYCLGNPIHSIWSLFRDASKIDQFNEWSIIQGDNVILYRLNDFLEEIGKEEVTEEQLIFIKNYYNVI